MNCALSLHCSAPHCHLVLVHFSMPM